MIAILHECFTKQLLRSCGLPESYVAWASAPDEDLVSWHRYKYHKLRSFSKLYDFYIQKYDMRNALDKDIVYFIFLSHLYLDMLNGPVKIFDGINITCTKKIFENIKKEGYKKTIRGTFKNIENLNEYYINGICSLFESTDFPKDINNISNIMYKRLLEETIGVINKKQNREFSIRDIHYNTFKQLEENIYLYTQHLV